MRILVVDNYDSFTYNLVHALTCHAGVEVVVERNDAVCLDLVPGYHGIVLSPGPGIPEESGQCLDIIRQFAETKKILGVCLGHQAIAVAMGGQLKNLTSVKHGIATTAHQTRYDVLFEGIEPTFQIGHYHSWVVASPLPSCLEVLANDDNGEIMALRHRSYNLCGVQFHPESILTPAGATLLGNWLRR